MQYQIKCLSGKKKKIAISNLLALQGMGKRGKKSGAFEFSNT